MKVVIGFFWIFICWMYFVLRFWELRYCMRRYLPCCCTKGKKKIFKEDSNLPFHPPLPFSSRAGLADCGLRLMIYSHPCAGVQLV